MLFIVAISIRFRALKPALCAAGLLSSLGAHAAAAAPDFSREVRPLLDTHCVKCHGPEKQKGGLRFDTKEGAFKPGESGEKAIVPGHASASRLIKLVSSKDDDERMPTKGEPLSAAQIDLLKRWIDAGAAWPEALAQTGAVARSEMIVTDEDRKHWSYLPLTNPPAACGQEFRLSAHAGGPFHSRRAGRKEAHVVGDKPVRGSSRVEFISISSGCRPRRSRSRRS